MATSLFFNQDGSVTVTTFWLLAGIPFLFSGRWLVAVGTISIGLVSALCRAMDNIAQEDKLEIQYNTYSADDVLREMKYVHECRTTSNPETLISSDDMQQRMVIALQSLAKKHNKSKKSISNQSHRPHELEQLCQEAVYLAMNLCPNHNESILAAISLHALIGKDTLVRKRHLHEADRFGLQIPVQAIKKALQRAQEIESQQEEEFAAELQRRGCLLLGALADGDPQVATRIAEEQGLEAILGALDWFRFHEDVANWGLWALFILCFDHPGNKGELIRLDGIQKICTSIQNCNGSVEVCRHGIAVLFDLLREASNQPVDVTTVRKLSIAAGLHKPVRAAMDNFPDSMEIMAMGTEMLLATGYTEDIPIYQPEKVN